MKHASPERTPLLETVERPHPVLSLRMLRERPFWTWAIMNWLLCNACWFVAGLGWGCYLLVAGPGSIPGYSGHPALQIFWSAVGTVLFGPLLLGIPVMALWLGAWTLLRRITGHTRLSAVLVSAALASVVGVALPEKDVAQFLVLGVAPVVLLGLVARPLPPDYAQNRPHLEDDHRAGA
jgi:hypothetical protein